jgi:hypothetical protein
LGKIFPMFLQWEARNRKIWPITLLKYWGKESRWEKMKIVIISWVNQVKEISCLPWISVLIQQKVENKRKKKE